MAFHEMTECDRCGCPVRAAIGSPLCSLCELESARCPICDRPGTEGYGPDLCWDCHEARVSAGPALWAPPPDDADIPF